MARGGRKVKQKLEGTKVALQTMKRWDKGGSGKKENKWDKGGSGARGNKNGAGAAPGEKVV